MEEYHRNYFIILPDMFASNNDEYEDILEKIAETQFLNDTLNDQQFTSDYQINSLTQINSTALQKQII